MTFQLLVEASCSGDAGKHWRMLWIQRRSFGVLQFGFCQGAKQPGGENILMPILEAKVAILLMFTCSWPHLQDQ